MPHLITNSYCRLHYCVCLHKILVIFFKKKKKIEFPFCLFSRWAFILSMTVTTFHPKHMKALLIISTAENTIASSDL